MPRYQAAAIDSTDFDPIMLGFPAGDSRGLASRRMYVDGRRPTDARGLSSRRMYVDGRRPTDAGKFGAGDIHQQFHDAQVFVGMAYPNRPPALYDAIDRVKSLVFAGQYHEAQVLTGQIIPVGTPKAPIRQAMYDAIENVWKDDRESSSGIGGALRSVGNTVASVGGGIVSGVGSVAHLVTTPIAAAAAIARGDNVASTLGNAWKSTVKDISDVAPLAQSVLQFVPAVGQGINGALAAGVALAQGQPITSALLGAVRGALGPVAGQVFDSARAIASGQNVGQAALDVARNQATRIPGGTQAFDTAVALAHGQKIQDALKGTAMNVAQSALADFVQHPLAAADPLSNLGAKGKAALSALSPQVNTVARALLANPALRSLPMDQVARKLGNVPLDTVKGAVASIVGTAKSRGATQLIPQPALANRLGSGHSLDQALAAMGANNAPPRFSPNAIRRALPRSSDARGLDSSGMVWLVTSGDTMSKIAKSLTGDASRYPEMASLNGIANANLIKVGQRLNLPLSWVKNPPPAASTPTVSVTLPGGTTVPVTVPVVVASAPPPAKTPSGMPLIYQGVGDPTAIAKWQDIMSRVMGVTFPQTTAGGRGTFGPLTTSTTIAFQKKEGLSADGKVGDDTWNRGLFRFAQMGAATPISTTGPTPPIVPGLPPVITLPPGTLPPLPVALPPLPTLPPGIVPTSTANTQLPGIAPNITPSTPAPSGQVAPTATPGSPAAAAAKPASNGDWLIPAAAAVLALIN